MRACVRVCQELVEYENLCEESLDNFISKTVPKSVGLLSIVRYSGRHLNVLYKVTDKGDSMSQHITIWF